MTEMQRDKTEDVDLMEELVEKCLETIQKKSLDIKHIDAREENAWRARCGWKMCDE